MTSLARLVGPFLVSPLLCRVPSIRRLRAGPRFVGALVLVGVILQPAVSQSQAPQVRTEITSSGLNTTVTPPLPGGTAHIISGGTTQGPNLFHSFGLFSVGGGDTAKFNNTTSGVAITNILSRVTGGEQSIIHGTIDTMSYPGANLFLINPAGMMFGAGARLDIAGSFHASTASHLRFPDVDGQRVFFHVDPALDGAVDSVLRPGLLNVGSPVAFGFLGPTPAEISIQGSNLAVPAGQTLSMIGGNVQITGSKLSAPSGRIQMAGVASPGEVISSPPNQPPDLHVDSSTRTGRITVSQQAGLSVDGNPTNVNAGGTIVIRGGQVVLQTADLTARGNPGGAIRIGGEQLLLDQTDLNTGTLGALDHPGTAVDVQVAGRVTLTNGSEIASSGFGAGRAGDVRIVAGSVVLGDEDPATSAFASTGFYGDIGSRAFGPGPGGNVKITTESLTVRNGFFINTAALSSGDAGNVTVRADKLFILDGASISSNAFALGKGGIVDILAADALFSARNINSVPNCPCFTGVAAQTGFGSKGGVLRLTADTLQLLEGGRISTVLFSTGPGASIEVTAKTVVISGVVMQATASPSEVHAGLDARLIGSFATGTGGDIRVTADLLQVMDGGSITSSLDGGAPGNAGNIRVNAGRLEIRDRGSIAASAFAGSGNSGSLVVTADTVVIAGVGDSPDPFVTDFTGLSTATGVAGKRGGDLRVTAKSVQVESKGTMASVSLGAGEAGNIQVDAGSLLVTGGATIVSSAFGSGPGGKIEVTARDLTVAGAGQFNGPQDAGVSGISSQAGLGGGDAGNVGIVADSLRVLDGAKLTTETFGAGDGGSITVSARNVLVSGVNASLREALLSIPGADPTAASAAITASSNRFFLGDAATGHAGNVRITAGDIQVSAEGVISSKTDTPGRGGNISIQAGQVRLDGGATVSARSSGTGEAGSLTINAGDEFRSQNSVVTTEAVQADGGNIDIVVGSRLHLTSSEISTSVQSGVGKGGNITIDPEFVILDRSPIRADAFGGPGGNVRIVADIYLASDSVVSASSALSTPGTINIQADITDVSGSLVQLSEKILQAAALLRASCAARLAGGKASSLVVTGREGMPPEPGSLLASPLVVEGPADARPSRSEGHQWETLAADRYRLVAPSSFPNRWCSR